MGDIMEDPGLNKYFVTTKTEGKQYQEAGYYEKALEQYNYAFNFFMVPLELYESSVVSLKDEISLLFLLLSLVAEVKSCYTALNEPYKALIFQKNFEEIVNTIGKYEKNLTPKEFIAYKKLSKSIELSDSDEDILLGKCRKILLEDPSQSVESSNDPLFIELRSKFDKCCSYQRCLLPSRGVILSSSSSSCFIATAAYSTSAHPDIDTFRNFRDKKLLTNPVGQGLVSLYYKISPSIANYVKRQPVIKSFLRQQLERLAEWMRSQEAK